MRPEGRYAANQGCFALCGYGGVRHAGLLLWNVGQLKMVIDRFYSCTMKLAAKHLKTALIAVAWDSHADVMPDLLQHYKKLCRYMNFTDCGQVLGTGCGTLSMTKSRRHMEEAYRH